MERETALVFTNGLMVRGTKENSWITTVMGWELFIMKTVMSIVELGKIIKKTEKEFTSTRKQEDRKKLSMKMEIWLNKYQIFPKFLKMLSKKKMRMPKKFTKLIK